MTFHQIEQALANPNEAIADIALEVSSTGPVLRQSNIQASELKKGTMYMVNQPLRFPIHPHPNADHIISKLVLQFQVIVTNNETNVDNGLYLRTVLPVQGWILKACTTDGTLLEIDRDTFKQLIDRDGKDFYDNNDTARNAQIADFTADVNHDESSNGCCSCCGRCLRKSRVVRAISIKVRKHPVYVIAGVLVLHFFAECVIFADLLTDLRVASTLSNANENWLFMLTCVFILAPYYIAWAAAFGYLQKLAMESSTTAELKAEEERMRALKSASTYRHDNNDDNDGNKDDNKDGSVAPAPEILASTGTGTEADTEEKQKKKKVSGAPAKKIQLGVILFAVAPIGVFFLMCLDVYLLLEDFLIKPVYLCCTKRRLREESHAERGYKKLRRVSEVVAETICQTVLQLYIYARFSRADGNPNGVDLTTVLSSLVTSVLVLVMWTSVLKLESTQAGLHFYEYVTVVLQGSFNFVPLLPSIERGKRTRVNWTDFRFDSHSVGLVSKALISPECTLQSIKLSAYSLKKLTRHECRFLGQMLADSPKGAVEVTFSRSEREIEQLFAAFDDDNSRTFDFREFLQLCAALRQNDDGVVSAQDVAQIFVEIADAATQELYLTDLLFKVSHSTEPLLVVDYDSPVMYALKSKQSKLLTFMMAAKVCDDVTWEYYTTTLVTQHRAEDALRMCEERGVPIVIEIERAHELPAHDFDDELDPTHGTSDPYASVSVAGKVKRTETIMKELNPVWNQSLLFIIPTDAIPDLDMDMDMDLDADDLDLQHNTIKNANANASANANGNEMDSGGVGRLEINIKVYDYDDTDDDFFMGSHKHFVKWTVADLVAHQARNAIPRLFKQTLKNRDEEVGRFEFRIYTQTLLFYMRCRNNPLYDGDYDRAYT